MKKDKETKNQAAAEIPDDAELDLGLDHDLNDDFVVVNADPNYHYFLAANDDDKDRPDGVFKCKLMGYEECKDEYATGGTDCKLLRIKRKIFDARRKRKRDARIAAKEAERKPKGVPSDHMVTMERRGPETVKL